MFQKRLEKDYKQSKKKTFSFDFPLRVALGCSLRPRRLRQDKTLGSVSLSISYIIYMPLI